MAVETPHDKVFKFALNNLHHARNWLQAELPANLRAQIDWSTLTAESESFVSESLKALHSDHLFSAKMDGHDLLIYLLFEHQSSVDSLMAFRMLDYLVAIWKWYIRNHVNAKRLPVVIPLVLYHGERPWHAPLDIREIIALPDGHNLALEDYLPRFKYLLDDLTGLTPEDLKDRGLSDFPQLVVWLLSQLRFHTDQISVIEHTWTLFQRLERTGARAEILAAFEYIISVSSIEQKALNSFAERLGSDVKGDIMTLAEVLRQEGKIEGKLEGKLESKQETLVNLLTLKFSGKPSNETMVLIQTTESSEQLEAWIARVLNASSLDDVFELPSL